MKKSKFIVCAIIILILSLATALAVQQTFMSLQGRVTNSDGTVVNTANLTAKISYTESCESNVFWTNNYENEIDDGYFAVLLGENTPLYLDFNKIYYLCTYVNDELVSGPSPFRGGQGQIDVTDINITSDYQFGNINVTGHIDIGTSPTDRVRMFFVKTINSITNWLKIEGNVFIQGNLTVNGTLQSNSLQASGKKGDDNYLTNDSNTMYFNETKMNSTINTIASGHAISGTKTGSQGPYLYNNTNDIFFNETKLNQTIDARDTASSDSWWEIEEKYLINDSNVLKINETQMNNTIDNRDTDTTYSSDEIYINQDGTTFNLNETQLNQTIDARDTTTDTVWELNQTTIINQSDKLSANMTFFESMFFKISDFFTKDTSSRYLYNDSTKIYFNETQLNSTIDSRSINSDIDTWWFIEEKYLINDSNTLKINETKLNQTIDARDTSTTDTVWELNQTTIINQSDKLSTNMTFFEGLFLKISDFFTKNTSSKYLYNDSTKIYFNETQLNETIQDQKYDYQKHINGNNVTLVFTI